MFVGSATNPGTVLLNPNGSPNSDAGQRLLRRRLHDGRHGPSASQRASSVEAAIWTHHGIQHEHGTIAWQIPNGDTPPNIKANLAAAGLTNVPPTGSPSQAGLLVTKNFLFAGEGSGGQAVLPCLR